MSLEEYIEVRPRYLETERAFRRIVGVILKRPDNYDNDENIKQYHEEIWDDGVDEIWDAEREFNLDEVPFTMNTDSKQIVAITKKERASLNLSKSLKYHGKYRHGTLVIITNFRKIWLVVIIFSGGGSGVEKKLRKSMQGSVQGKVMWECSESGNMTAAIWKKTLNFFNNLTKTLRGCEKLDSTDWTKAIILNIDNYSVHLEAKIADHYAHFYGIFIRCLLRNASHIQQPIDQHVGIFIRNILIHLLEKVIISNNRYHSFGTELQLNKQKWREMIAGLVVRAIDEIELRKNLCVLVMAWINFGLYLNHNMTEDGNINTLHIDGKTRTLHTKEKRKRTQNCINKVTIKKNPIGYIKRENHIFRDNNYNIHTANANSRLSTNRIVHNLNSHSQNSIFQLQHDLHDTNENAINKFKQDFENDWTNTKNDLPDLCDVVAPFDVLTLQKMYTEHKSQEEMENLFLTELGIPVRDEHGRIMKTPPSGL